MRENGSTQGKCSLTGELEFLSIFSLFDITSTGVLRNYDARKPAFIDAAGQCIRTQDEWDRSRNQQRNWETVMQLIGMRAQPIILEDPKVMSQVKPELWGLGTGYTGLHDVWVTSFAVEHLDVYGNLQDPLGILRNECQYIPMIVNLKETATFNNAYIETTGEFTNVAFGINYHVEGLYAQP